jgi:hypothetical protein
VARERNGPAQVVTVASTRWHDSDVVVFAFDYIFFDGTHALGYLAASQDLVLENIFGWLI